MQRSVGSRNVSRRYGPAAGLVALALLAGCVRGPLVGPPKPPSGTFAFPVGKDEIEAGYDTYYDALSPYGSWLPDSAWGVRFCPTLEANASFRPFVDRGHWSATRPEPVSSSEAEKTAEIAPKTTTSPAGPGAGSADSPYWIADSSDAWGDITGHHGWWVEYSAEKRFCWVPGTQFTNARVVWREGNGFVGWAAEPPVWIDDGGDADLPWVFTFLASLYSPSLGSDCICDGGDAYDRVAAVTASVRPQRDSDAKATANRKTVISHQGPAREHVVAAHSALAAFALTQITTPLSTKPAPKNGSSDSESSDSKSDDPKKKRIVFDDDLRPAILLPFLLAAPPPNGRFLPNVFAPSAVALDVRSGSSATTFDAPQSSTRSNSSSYSPRSFEGSFAPTTSSGSSSAAPTRSVSNNSSSSSSSSSSPSRSHSTSSSTTVATPSTRPTVSVGK